MKNSGIEWIGEIPDSWESFRLKDYYVFEKGKNAALYTQEYIGMHSGEYPVYSGQTEDNGVMGTIASYDYDEKECLFTTTVGAKVMTAKLLSGKFSLSQNCLIMKQSNNCYNKYIYYYLIPLFDYEKSLIPAYMQPSLRIADLNKYNFCVPSITEQQKIADILDEKCGKIDKLIENEQKQIEKMKEYKQSVITSAVTKGLDKSALMKNSGIDWIGEIPESWQLRKLNYCFDLIGSGTTPKSDNEEFYGEEIAWLQSGDINGGYVYKTEKMIVGKAIETYSALKIYQAPFLTVAMYGASVGNCSIVKLDAATNQACCVMSKSKGYLKYLFYCILAGKIALIDLAKGGTQPNIRQEIIKNFRVPFPLTNEQKEIVDYLDEKRGKIDEVISIKQRKIEKLQEYKKSLIYEYVTGKKEVG